MSDTEKVYAKTEDDKCCHDECWLLNGHAGLHSYHPALLGIRPTNPN